MNLRNYNIYFHTHTISGIVISLVLYVIFFAGSFAFFKSEISSWQHNTPNAAVDKGQMNMNRVLDSMTADMNLYGRDLFITLNDRSRRMIVSASASKDSTVKGRGGYFYLDGATFRKNDYKESYDLGEFLYRLHFLAPLNVIGGRGFPFGYYVAGVVALFFLFAIITGTLVHWKKIVSNFYVFRPWEKLKTLWTDIHTALGVITLPFLFVFAVTGAYYLISAPLVTKPVAAYQYGGSTGSLLKATSNRITSYPFAHQALDKSPDLNAYYQDAGRRMPDTKISSIVVSNYGDQSMHVTVKGTNPHRNFTGSAAIVYNGQTGAVEHFTPLKAPGSYNQAVDSLMYTLHFGNFGGNIVRILYFLLGIAGCIVIISGVMIWLVARRKAHIPEKRRRFNEWLAGIYLSACASMYPVTAAVFIAVKLNPDGGRSFIYGFYFWLWLVVTVLLLLRRNTFKTTRDCLLAGSLLGLIVPVVNGLMTGNWIWISWRQGFYDLLFIDLLWIVMGGVTLVTWLLLIKKQQGKLMAAPTGSSSR